VLNAKVEIKCDIAKSILFFVDGCDFVGGKGEKWNLKRGKVG
jgi:hypothetical protein